MKKKKKTNPNRVQFNKDWYPQQGGSVLSRGPHGLGVYWHETWAWLPGDEIESCPVILIPNERGLFSTPLQYFAYAVPNNPKAYAIALGWGSLYNHSETPNAKYVWEDGSIVIIAIRRIDPGEEITIDYGYTP